MLVDSRTDLEMCLVAVSEKTFCLRLSMNLSWEGMFAYAFPPFRFLAPVLHKITGEKCRIIVIAPAWPKQAWFANLLLKLRTRREIN
jgi:hypothetical protein